MIIKSAAQGGSCGIVLKGTADDEQASRRSEKIVISTNDALVKLTQNHPALTVDEPPGDDADSAAGAVVVDIVDGGNFELDDVRIGRPRT